MIDPSARGSSPRGRGAPRQPPSGAGTFRIIPAWAGRTRPLDHPQRAPKDHPRVGGAHAGTGGKYRTGSGSSPRGRGARWQVGSVQNRSRIIPAWAGRTSTRCAARPAGPDHPRVGGANDGVCLMEAVSWGSSPRGRGAPPRSPLSPFAPGSSPRGRGARREVRRRPRSGRIIPAWAGRTSIGDLMPWATPDHPRVGGAHSVTRMTTAFPSGSSPRGRGAQFGGGELLAALGIIPAWAGRTWRDRTARTGRRDHPRVGGAHPP